MPDPSSESSVEPSTGPSTWVFDVDASLFDSFSGVSLRPGGRRLLEALHARACRLVLWSAGGAVYARARAEAHELLHLFDGFFDKDQRDDAGRYSAAAFIETLAEAIFVDDRPEDLPVGADVVRVAPYIAPNQYDRGLSVVAARAGLEWSDTAGAA